MTFEEIFKEDGLYVASSFTRGTVFEIELGALYVKTYRNENDINPDKYPQLVYSGLFKKEYSKVLNRQSLFK